MMVLYVGHLLYDDYRLERIYDVLYVYKVHYTLPERIRYNRIMHLCGIQGSPVEPVAGRDILPSTRTSRREICL